MIRRKTGLMTFIFSFIPGAGEMYMGFFKQGISIMSAFFILISISAWMNLGPLMFTLPVLWFYSFFHAHNLASMRDEDFYSLEDKFLFIGEYAKFNTMVTPDKGRKVLAAILIILGLTSLWNMLCNVLYSIAEPLLGRFANGFYDFINSIPQFVFAVIIICGGIYLIKGKKKELAIKDMSYEESEHYRAKPENFFYEDVNESMADKGNEVVAEGTEGEKHEDA